MTKAERLKLHKILTSINTEIKSVKAVLKLQGNMVNQLDTDVRNLFHVVKETQEQQRANLPNLRVIGNDRGPKTPRTDR